MRVVVLGLVALALGVVNTAIASTSGLTGLVTMGPTTPVCVAGISCSKPAKNVVITFKRGSSRQSVKTDSNGRYHVGLAPGTWTISIAGTRFGYRPRTALVPRGTVGVRNIAIDTGIR